MWVLHNNSIPAFYTLLHHKHFNFSLLLILQQILFLFLFSMLKKPAFFLYINIKSCSAKETITVNTLACHPHLYHHHFYLNKHLYRHHHIFNAQNHKRHVSKLVCTFTTKVHKNNKAPCMWNSKLHLSFSRTRVTCMSISQIRLATVYWRTLAPLSPSLCCPVKPSSPVINPFTAVHNLCWLTFKPPRQVDRSRSRRKQSELKR